MDEERFKLVYKKIVDSYQLDSKIAKRINDNLNMYINDHLRMYTSDYALI